MKSEVEYNVAVDKKTPFWRDVDGNLFLLVMADLTAGCRFGAVQLHHSAIPDCHESGRRTWTGNWYATSTAATAGLFPVHEFTFRVKP